MIGTILRAQSGFFWVQLDETGETLRCVLRGRLKRVRQHTDLATLGDRVRVMATSPGEGAIEEVQPRRTKLARQEGRYRIVRKLGEGGQGEVYLVEHLHLGRTEALKVLRAQHARDEQFVSRFRREARATNKVQHPNIVGVYDFDTVPNAESKAQGDAFLGDLASPSKWGVAEPINYVGGGDPPGFILGGENDTLIGTQNAILFHDKLRDAGINATLIVAPGYGHNARVYLMNNEDIQRQLFDFLDDEMPQ